jgi:hypothetical protein
MFDIKFNFNQILSFQVMFFSVNPFQFRVMTSCGTILHVDEHTTYIVIYTMYTDQEKSRQDEHMTYMLFIPCILGINNMYVICSS